MSSAPYTLHAVHSARDERRWLDVAYRCYADDPVWVAPLEDELRNTFDPRHNPAFANGAAARWYLTDAQGRLAGRIAAFVQRDKAARYDRPVGGAGFFECVDDTAAAHLLFDTARNWLAEHGMQGMDAPVNFGENDRFAGLLIEGFTHPAFGMNYHLPYYQRLFTSYGFAKYYDQVSLHLPVAKGVPERFQKAADWVLRKPGVHITHATRRELPYFTRAFQTVYNDAWQHHLHFTPITDEAAAKLAAELRPILLERIMIFAFVDDEPAGILLSLPDLNQVFKPLRGKFPLWQKLLFAWRARNDLAWYRRRGILDRCRTIIVGVRPKFQKYGLDVAMVAYGIPQAQQYGLVEGELGWVGDWNPLSRALQANAGGEPGKTHRTYRIWFDGSDVQPMTSVAG